MCLPPPYVENSFISYQLTSPKASNNSIASYSCFVGYRIQTGLTNEVSICHNDFSWDVMDNCKGKSVKSTSAHLIMCIKINV